MKLDFGIFNFDRCGYKKVGGQIVTKHDREMSERSNGRRMMEFPPGIHTGDGAALNGPQIQVSNSVYNKIRSGLLTRHRCFVFDNDVDETDLRTCYKNIESPI